MLFGLHSCSKDKSEGLSLGHKANEIRAKKQTNTQQDTTRRKTTSPEIALGNLDAKILGQAKQVASKGIGLNAYAESLKSRMQFKGSYSDFDELFKTLKNLQDKDGKDFVQAKIAALMAIHRFDDANKLLGENSSIFGEGEKKNIELSLAAAKENISDLDFAIVQKKAKDHSNFQNRTRLAHAYALKKEFKKADKAYQDALKNYRDVSPFPFAWAYFQLGKMWAESADDLEKGQHYYQEAILYLPDYVVANVHLSEIEFEKGQVKQAISRLERIKDKTEDPEPFSRLAQYYAGVDKAKSEIYKKQAKDGYEKWLAKYPLAFADHATEFYLGAGADPKRAFELAELNFNNRQTHRAAGLLAESAIGVERIKKACELVATYTLSFGDDFKEALKGCPKG